MFCPLQNFALATPLPTCILAFCQTKKFLKFYPKFIFLCKTQDTSIQTNNSKLRIRNSKSKGQVHVAYANACSTSEIDPQLNARMGLTVRISAN